MKPRGCWAAPASSPSSPPRSARRTRTSGSSTSARGWPPTHPKVTLAVIRPSDGDRDRAFAETQTILKVYPKVRVVMGIAAPAVPGIAEAVKQSGRTDVKVTGLSLPNMCKPYVHAGIISSIVLWNTGDLGYLTVLAGHRWPPGSSSPARRRSTRCAWETSPSTRIRFCWASRSCSRKRTSIISISNASELTQRAIRRSRASQATHGIAG